MATRAFRIGTFVKPLLGLALLAWLLSQLQWSELVAVVARPERTLFWLGTLCLLASFGVEQPLRLHVVLRDYTGSFGGSLKLSMIGALFNNLLPSNVGGDAVRLWYLVRARPGNLGAPLALLLLLRVSQLGILLVVAALCALADLPRLSSLLSGRLSMPTSAALWAAVLVIGLALAAGVLWGTKPGRRLRDRTARVVDQARTGIGQLSVRAHLALLLHTLLYHAARVAGFCLLCRYAGAPLAVSDALLVLALTALAGLLPITVGGLGVMEGAIVVGLMLFGVPHAAAVVVALVNRAALLPPALAGGVVYALDRDRLARVANVEKPDTA